MCILQAPLCCTLPGRVRCGRRHVEQEAAGTTDTLQNCSRTCGPVDNTQCYCHCSLFEHCLNCVNDNYSPLLTSLSAHPARDLVTLMSDSSRMPFLTPWTACTLQGDWVVDGCHGSHGPLARAPKSHAHTSKGHRILPHFLSRPPQWSVVVLLPQHHTHTYTLTHTVSVRLLSSGISQWLHNT